MSKKELISQLGLEQEILEAVIGNINSSSYTDGVRSAFIVLTTYIREISGEDGDGVGLIGEAFGKSTPKIQLAADIKTTTGNSIQQGIQSILRGMYQAFRNPRNHELYQDDEETGIRLILMIDTLLKFIKKNKVDYFNEEEFFKRILDPHFPKNSVYAYNVVAEIPDKYKFSIFIKALDNILVEGAGVSYTIFALYRVFNQETLKQAAEEIAIRTRNLTIDSYELKRFIFVLRSDMWTLINKVDRIRLENMIIQDLKEGKISPNEETGILGALGRKFGEYFTLREQLVDAIIERLGDYRYSQNYIAKYYLSFLPKIFISTEEITIACKLIVISTVSAKCQNMRTSLPEKVKKYPDTWRKELRKAFLDKELDDRSYVKSFIKILDELDK